MPDDSSTRRAFTALVGSAALAGAAGGVTGAPSGRRGRRRSTGSRAQTDPVTSWDSYTIMDGTEYETRVYVREADVDGPTALVVGGIHGNEESGFEAARDVADWVVESGTLVVLPEANRVAIEQDSRVAPGGVDLNRQFPVGEEPTTELARAIWEDVVLRFEPDTLVDLHSSVGIYDGDSDGPADGEGVGQAIFHSPTVAAETRAKAATEYLNEQYVPDSRPAYNFEAVRMDLSADPSGLLVGKAYSDLGTAGFLVEVTSDDLALETQVRWSRAAVRRLLEVELGDPNGKPTARIETTPADATAVELEADTERTVTFDATASADPEGAIVRYEWDVDGDGEFETTGTTAETHLGFCGELPVTLRVVDDAGRTDTATVTLTTT